MALPPPSPRPPSTIHLDYGADSAPFEPRDLKVCQRGLHLRTRWQFDPGTEVALNFQIDDGAASAGLRTLRTVGVVVGCEPDTRAVDAGFYRLTLMFVEMTDDVRTLVRAMTDYHRREGHAQGKRVPPFAAPCDGGSQPQHSQSQQQPEVAGGEA